MSKQEKLISADKLLKWIDSEEASVLWEDPYGIEKYQLVIGEIKAGTFDPDSVPTIKPGDKHRCPYCNMASTQQDWDEITDKKYDGDTTTIHDCKTLNLLAYFVCPSCGKEAELDQMEVVKDE